MQRNCKRITQLICNITTTKPSAHRAAFSFPLPENTSSAAQLLGTRSQSLQTSSQSAETRRATAQLRRQNAEHRHRITQKHIRKKGKSAHCAEHGKIRHVVTERVVAPEEHHSHLAAFGTEHKLTGSATA